MQRLMLYRSGFARKTLSRKRRARKSRPHSYATIFIANDCATRFEAFS
jgi:hypothetical protein